MKTKETTIWPERYRPNKLEHYIGNEKAKVKFAQFIEDQDIPHILMYGPPGTGKTTAAQLLVDNIQCDQLFLNASDENNIETVRSKIRGFAATQGFNNLKIIVLDEFDGFTKAGQGALRNIMEQFSHSTRFILTANYEERIIEPIISRTQTFQIIPPSKVEVAKHLANILKLENVTYTVDDVKLLIDAFFPDIRKVLNEAQLSSRNGSLVIDKKHLVENDFKLKIISVLQNKAEKNKLTTIRQLLINAQLHDFTDVYRILFDRVDDFAAGHIPEAIGTIADGIRWDSLVVDKEINMTATISSLIQLQK